MKSPYIEIVAGGPFEGLPVLAVPIDEITANNEVRALLLSLSPPITAVKFMLRDREEMNGESIAVTRKLIEWANKNGYITMLETNAKWQSWMSEAAWPIYHTTKTRCAVPAKEIVFHTDKLPDSRFTAEQSRNPPIISWAGRNRSLKEILNMPPSMRIGQERVSLMWGIEETV